jgi:hypothetical protein
VKASPKKISTKAKARCRALAFKAGRKAYTGNINWKSAKKIETTKTNFRRER